MKNITIDSKYLTPRDLAHLFHLLQNSNDRGPRPFITDETADTLDALVELVGKVDARTEIESHPENKMTAAKLDDLFNNTPERPSDDDDEYPGIDPYGPCEDADYACTQCGAPITAAEGDDNGGKCQTCAAGGEYPIDYSADGNEPTAAGHGYGF